jgi:hypothetical protein
MKAGKVSAAVCADVLGISMVTWAKLIDDGVVERQPASVGHDLRTVVRAAYAASQRRAAGRGAKGEGEVLSSARARQALAIAVKNEFANACTRAEFIHVGIFNARLERTFSVMKEKIVGRSGKIADAVCSFCPGAERSAIENILRNEDRELMGELSSVETYTAPGNAANDEASNESK